MKDLQQSKRDNANAQLNGFKARFRRATQLLPGGFTMDAYGHVVNRKDGFAVAVRSRATLDLLLYPYQKQFANPSDFDFYFGYWKDRDGREYFEVTRICNKLSVATEIAKGFKQQAIYDFKRHKEIYV